MFTFAAHLGTVIGFLVGFFIFFGALSPIKNRETLTVRNYLLLLLGIVILLSGLSILTKTLMWLGEVVFATMGVIVLWSSLRVEKQLGKTILAVLGFFIVMQPLHCVWMWAS